MGSDAVLSVYPPVVLASGSPRRLEILRAHGVEPKVIVPQVDENIPVFVSLEQAQELVQELALAKARAVHSICAISDSNYIIVAADTVVYKDRILGKPQDAKEATAMLQALRATSHEVLTGVALIDATTSREISICDRTTVFFKHYSDEQIAEYLRIEPPYDKAGSYGIQGIWGAQVDHLQGDRENVIGLPWHCIAQQILALSEAGTA
jgi:septum formation protein